MAQQSVERRYIAVSEFHYLASKTIPSGVTALAFVNPYFVKKVKIGDEVVGVSVVMKQFTPAGLKDVNVVRTKNNLYAPLAYLKIASSKPIGDGNFSGAEGDVVVVPPIMKALPTIIGSVGFIWGLGYAFKNKKGFWAYVGYSFLGSIGGSALGGLATVIAYPSTLDNFRNKKSFSGADGKRTGKSSGRVKGGCTCNNGLRL